MLASLSHVELASLEDVALQVLGVFEPSCSTCVFHGIYSVFVLSGHLWFGSFFPAEFATPVAVAVLGPEPLQLHRP